MAKYKYRSPELDADDFVKIQRALRKAGYTYELLNRLLREDNLVAIKELLLGRAKLDPIHRIINTDIEPTVPTGMRIVEHRKNGKLHWDPEKILLLTTRMQKTPEGTTGAGIYAVMQRHKVFNATLLDYLLLPQNTVIIPDEWKERHVVYFWGTIFENQSGKRFVYGMRFDKKTKGWVRHGRPIDDDIIWQGEDAPAAGMKTIKVVKKAA